MSEASKLSLETNILAVIFHVESSLKGLLIREMLLIVQSVLGGNNRLKGQLQRFHKLSLFDRFRHVENGLDINF